MSFEEITSEVSPRTSAQEDTGITYEQGHTEKLKSDQSTLKHVINML